jgi:hypothetical protein
MKSLVVDRNGMQAHARFLAASRRMAISSVSMQGSGTPEYRTRIEFVMHLCAKTHVTDAPRSRTTSLGSAPGGEDQTGLYVQACYQQLENGVSDSGGSLCLQRLSRLMLRMSNDFCNMGASGRKLHRILRTQECAP